ncbi:hypothetical protein C10C_0337 [Chlamydia serpentis]|uniref:Uncharacterized protein n=1 Tax=Chlamydia serpentis TaxID=1967782 RepID=A0A2R8FAR4_9CHLA|nr:hypothetical protein [Chlamydia serpentis]SPN73509.1 hypothetical protein C10C_0337 [Chlamydia serpentis]
MSSTISNTLNPTSPEHKSEEACQSPSSLLKIKKSSQKALRLTIYILGVLLIFLMTAAMITSCVIACVTLPFSSFIIIGPLALATIILGIGLYCLAKKLPKDSLLFSTKPEKKQPVMSSRIKTNLEEMYTKGLGTLPEGVIFPEARNILTYSLIANPRISLITAQAPDFSEISHPSAETYQLFILPPERSTDKNIEPLKNTIYAKLKDRLGDELWGTMKLKMDQNKQPGYWEIFDQPTADGVKAKKILISWSPWGLSDEDMEALNKADVVGERSYKPSFLWFKEQCATDYFSILISDFLNSSEIKSLHIHAEEIFSPLAQNLQRPVYRPTERYFLQIALLKAIHAVGEQFKKHSNKELRIYLTASHLNPMFPFYLPKE